MGFSADGLGAEPVAVVVPGCDEWVDPIDVSESAVVVGPEVNEQLAIKRATHGASPAMRVGRAFRERRPPWRVLSPVSARETVIVGITAFAPGSSTALMSGTRWVDLAGAAMLPSPTAS